MVFSLLGGAVIGLIAAALDRLIKPSAGKSPLALEADSEADGVWPLAPKPLEQPGS